MLTNQLSTRELLGSRRFYRRNSQGDRPQYGSNSQTQSSQAGSSEGMYSQMIDSQNSDVLFPQQQDSEGSVNYYQKYKAQGALFPTQGARQPISVVRGCPQMSLQEQMEVNRKRAKERDDREILNLFVSMLKDCVEEVKTLTTGVQDKIDKTATAQGEKAEQLLQKVTDELGKHAGRLQDAVKRREEDKAKLGDLESAMAAKDAEISQLKHQLREALAAKEDNIISTLTSTLTEQQELTREQISKLKDKENDNTEVLKESIKSCGDITRQLKQLEQQTKERDEAEKKNQSHKCCKDRREECDSNYSEKNPATTNISSKQQNFHHQNQQWSTSMAQQEQRHGEEQDISAADPQLENVHLKDGQNQIPVIWSKQQSHCHGLQPHMALSSIYRSNQLSCAPVVSANTSYPSYHTVAPSMGPVVVNPTTGQEDMTFAMTRRQSESVQMYGQGRVNGTLQNPNKSFFQQNMVEIKPRKPCDQDNILQQRTIPSTRISGQSMNITNNITNQHSGQLVSLASSHEFEEMGHTNGNSRQKSSEVKSTNQHQGQQHWHQDSTFQHHGQTNKQGWNSHQNQRMTNQDQGQRWSEVDREHGEFTSRLTPQDHSTTTASNFNLQHGQLPPICSTASLQSTRKQVEMSTDDNSLALDNELYRMQVGNVQPVFSPDIQQAKSGVKKQSPIATVLPQVRTRSMIQQTPESTKMENTDVKGQEMKEREGTIEPQVNVTKLRGRKSRKKLKPAVKSVEDSQMESEAVDISDLPGTSGLALNVSKTNKRSKSESREESDKGHMKKDEISYPSPSPYSPDCPPVPFQSSEELPAWRQSGRFRKRSHSCTDLSNSKGGVMKASRDKPGSVEKRKAKMVGNKTPSDAKGSTYEAKALVQSSTGLQHMKIRKAIQMWRPASHTDISKSADQSKSASVYDFEDHEADVPGIKPAVRSAKKVTRPQNLINTPDTRLKHVNTLGEAEDANSDKRDTVKQYVSPYSDVEEPESDDPYEEDVREADVHHVRPQAPDILKDEFPKKSTFDGSRILQYQDSDENFSNTYDDRKEDTFEKVLQFSKTKNSPYQDSEEELFGSEGEGMAKESVDPLSLDIFSQGKTLQSDSPSLKKTLAIAQKWATGKSAKSKENNSRVVSNQHQSDSDSSSSPSLWIMEDFFKPGTSRDVKPQVSRNTSQGTKRKGQLTMNIDDVDPGSSPEASQSQDYFSLKIPDSPVRPRHDLSTEQVVPDQSPATPQSIRLPPSPKQSRGSGLKRKLCDSSASWFVDASRECLKQLRSSSHRTAHK
ncbi:uncharacterized protein LOC144885198 [Branchiostoma floridae x Branchiostoma japonicum]